MTEQILKLSPHRDLQCYFERPSAIAALSDCDAHKFTLSGSWRQQNDWAVVEWNRDNVFEHPLFRSLPDGDLSGLTLQYDEERENCIPLASDLYPLVDWPFLRIWTNAGGVDRFHKIRLRDYSQAVGGAYVPATAEFELLGSVTAGDVVGLAWAEEHHTYTVYGSDTLESLALAIAASVNAFSPVMRAEATGPRITLTYVGPGETIANSTQGENGNRFGAYSYTSAGSTLSWSAAFSYFNGGTSPTRWRVTLPFGNLVDIDGALVDARNVRKMRWTYAAAFQRGAYARTEFCVRVTNWNVTGTGRVYSVAGPGSRRIEDDDSSAVAYTGTWTEYKPGNFSGGSIHHATQPGASARIRYQSAQNHSLYLGTRYAAACGQLRFRVDSSAWTSFNLNLPGEDVLCRKWLGDFGPGGHIVEIEHAGANGEYIYFDFLEVAINATIVQALEKNSKITLATDWDTDHSIAVPAERTAWMLTSLGFEGRANHYVGALWFYELYCKNHQYASAQVTFAGTASPNSIVSLIIGRTDQPQATWTTLNHLVHIGDTAETLAKAFEMRLNSGFTSVRAEAVGGVLTVYSRSMGKDGNAIVLQANGAEGLSATTSHDTLIGGQKGDWRTDLNALPRLNRACRDWSRAFFRVLAQHNIDVASAFSTELQHGDPDLDAGIAQRYPSGKAVELNTPALQTNFSPISLAYWRDVYLGMAELMSDAGIRPYLQFGEVQWWYFPYDGSGMPFYDTYTTSRFQQQFGRPLPIILNGSADPELLAAEGQYLSGLIGEFTESIMNYVRSTFPNCRFEVLYPTDVNDTRFNAIANYPNSHWTPEKLDNLKTESFTYTYSRNLNLCYYSVKYAETRGFGTDKCSHLVGISDPISPWMKEVDFSLAENNESVVLFALDQYCLIGYPNPTTRPRSRSASFRR
ncbi:MAG TPA: hypothetical protein VE621_09880 [Bryobacteraceae bacterium]|nr:hypothetical protein [Bryobacteraceae bacterium]